MLEVKRTAFPPGRNCGQRWVTSPACVSSVEKGSGFPPAEETWDMPTRVEGVKTMVPSSPHAPPRSSGESHSVTAAPPCTEIFFNLPSAKNAIHWLSGEKNGSRGF